MLTNLCANVEVLSASSSLQILHVEQIMLAILLLSLQHSVQLKSTLPGIHRPVCTLTHSETVVPSQYWFAVSVKAVVSFFLPACIEVVVWSLEEHAQGVKKLAQLFKPGGTFLLLCGVIQGRKEVRAVGIGTLEHLVFHCMSQWKLWLMLVFPLLHCKCWQMYLRMHMEESCHFYLVK